MPYATSAAKREMASIFIQYSIRTHKMTEEIFSYSFKPVIILPVPDIFVSLICFKTLLKLKYINKDMIATKKTAADIMYAARSDTL